MQSSWHQTAEIGIYNQEQKHETIKIVVICLLSQSHSYPFKCPKTQQTSISELPSEIPLTTFRFVPLAHIELEQRESVFAVRMDAVRVVKALGSVRGRKILWK
jgi:hypothetical protein